MDQTPKIYSAISKTMADVGIVGKADKNDFDGYKYRGIDAVMNALNPAMIKNKIFVVPKVLDSSREERKNAKGTMMMYSILTVKYTFYAEDGSSVETIVVGEAMDRSDKSTNKAMSAAFKYACFQTFCIPTEEMKDSEEESPEIGEPVKPDEGRKAKASEPAESDEMNKKAKPIPAGYPKRDEMLAVCVKHYVGENLENLKKYFKVSDIKFLKNEQLIVAYDKATKK